ncbi:hypothetical protein ACFQQB_28240 [Nonomuraea rubra]
MGFASRLQESFYRWTGRAELAETLRAERLTVEHLQESLADLERRMYEPGWQQMTALAEQEFSREGLKRLTAVCRVMGIKNVLIKEGLPCGPLTCGDKASRSAPAPVANAVRAAPRRT